VGLVWADLSKEKLEVLFATENEDEKVRYGFEDKHSFGLSASFGFFETSNGSSRCHVRLLSSWVRVQHYEENPRSAIMVDFFLYTIIFSQDQGLSPEQTSALFSILKVVFDKSFGDKNDQASRLAPLDVICTTVGITQGAVRGVFMLTYGEF
jgi:hypothetical protein